MENITEVYNFYPINDSLSTSGQPTGNQLRAMAADGYEVIINLALHDDPRYSLPDETGLVESVGMVYVHLPVRFNDPGEEDLLGFFQAMETHAGKKIHIHCAANMRVTAFFGLYCIVKLGQTEYDAFEPMRAIWEPNDVWSSFIARMTAKYATQPGAATEG